ncbi:hypothetical protein M513_01274 [Trichuris suis]|uniref:Uncharacterized protein n=1 Tax=Trichuris suis TaxID=68888 RepID=A0A085MLE5_9BILA|nr:hypothetical protein M513_01274 [Trichuris suis]
MTARLQNKHATEQDECHITDIMKYGTFFNGTRPIPSSACCHIMKTLQTGSDAFSESSEFIRKKKQVQRTQYALNMATDINVNHLKKRTRREGRLLITGQEFVLRRDINGLIVITLEEKEARSNSSRLPGRLVTLQKKYDLFFYLYCRGQLKGFVSSGSRPYMISTYTPFSFAIALETQLSDVIVAGAIRIIENSDTRHHSNISYKNPCHSAVYYQDGTDESIKFVFRWDFGFLDSCPMPSSKYDKLLVKIPRLLIPLPLVSTEGVETRDRLRPESLESTNVMAQTIKAPAMVEHASH